MMMMMTRVLVVVALGLVVAVSAVPTRQLNNANTPPLKWGRDGHIITGLVAQGLLDSATAKAVKEIIPDEDGQLGQVTDWADQIKDDRSYAWSFGLHFINTPDWKCNFDHDRDCGDERCVSGAITNYTKRLTSETGDQQNEALKFLVHFIGDIHQPLHVGFTSDKGGNTIHVEYDGRDENLHQVWDTGMIFTLIDADYDRSYEKLAADIVKNINGTWASKAKEWLECKSGSFPCPDEWAEESIELACSNAYVQADGRTHVSDGDRLGSDYYDANVDVLQEQLAKSGVRMAETLKQALQ